MKHGNNNTKVLVFILAGLFVLTGTYNAVIINSESQISSSDVRFVKRLDEIYGVTISGREVAASVTWQKLAPQKQVAIAPAQIYRPVSRIESAPSVTESVQEVVPAAAVQEELTLSLVEVINPKKWQQGLSNTQFTGTLSTNNGVIENLSVSLPNDEGVSVSFSEMTGNVFEYDLNGDLYSGMMYQVDQNSYMVTLTNGPLEGTRLRFAGELPVTEQPPVEEYLAENNSDEVNNPGQDTIQAEEASPDALVQNDQQMQQEALEAQNAAQNLPASM